MIRKYLKTESPIQHFKRFTLHNFYYGVLSAFHYMHVVLIKVKRIYVCLWREECMPICLQSHLFILLLSLSCNFPSKGQHL